MAIFLVDEDKIKKNILKLKKAFKDLDFHLFYSVKTNYARPVLKAIKESGLILNPRV